MTQPSNRLCDTPDGLSRDRFLFSVLFLKQMGPRSSLGSDPLRLWADGVGSKGPEKGPSRTHRQSGLSGRRSSSRPYAAVPGRAFSISPHPRDKLSQFQIIPNRSLFLILLAVPPPPGEQVAAL